MTPQQLKAMKLALEALYPIAHNTTGDPRGQADKAITAIKEVLAEHAMRETQRLGQEIEQEPLEYWNAVEGWVKIDEVRKHFDSVGCGTIYKSAGEGRVPLSLAKAQPEQEPVAYDKTEMNCFVQDLYDKKMKEGKHGHYETMFHVVHQAIKKVPPQRTERNFCERCGKRTKDIHTCTPPRENT